MRLIKIEKEKLEDAGVPFTKSTLYVWHSRGQHPELFVKLGKRLMLNLDEFDNWAKMEIEKTSACAEHTDRSAKVEVEE